MNQHTNPPEAITHTLTAARYTRRRLLGMTAVGAGAAILAACGGTGSSATSTPAPTSTGGAKVVITTPTSAAAPASGSAAAASGSGTSAAAPAGSAAAPAGSASASGRTGLKGKITIARQPAAPLSNGKDDPSNVVFQQLIDRYQKEHPGVTIEWIRVPGSSFDQLTQWITTRQASKSVPILSGHFSSTTSAQEASNTSPWIPMTPYLDANSAYTGKPWKQDFPADALAYIQGSLKQIYYVTLNAYKAAWLYNKPLWNKAGLTEADEPKTWVDFFKVLDKLKASGVIPIARAGDAFALSHAYQLLTSSLGRKDWLAMSGGQVFASDPSRFGAVCAGTWKMDTPWNRKAAEVTKQLFQYWPPGSTSLQASDIEQLWLTQKAVLWQGTPTTQGQTILRRLDENKAEGLQSFDVGAFPTPQPDAETFGADLAKNAAPIADDGERGLGYQIAIPDIRQDKDPDAEAISIDFLQWMTTPEIQAIYVKPSYDLPINPNVTLDDPRLALFYKNKNQLFPASFFYGNRPDWIPNYQAYLLGQKDLNGYIKDEQAEVLAYTQQTIRASKLNIACG
ncbi:MAG: ABC transporter substrate-binding protein [Chloroflexota bacterium]|nr:ABC transporter substrate-binding protein [Chloroflexota bacterium]